MSSSCHHPKGMIGLKVFPSLRVIKEKESLFVSKLLIYKMTSILIMFARICQLWERLTMECTMSVSNVISTTNRSTRKSTLFITETESYLYEYWLGKYSSKDVES